MKGRKFNRRRFLAAMFLACPAAAVADAKWLEPCWVKVKHIKLGGEKSTHRFVHFTDVHHKGGRVYLESVVTKINTLSPDFVCFTGDLIEQQKHLAEALDIFGKIKSPLYGVPGNHDYWSRVSFDGFTKCFTASGGGWLLDSQMTTPDGKISILGATCLSTKQVPLAVNPATKNILLMHYPAWVKKLGVQKFDLMLAGHSHGGQVRLPIFGPVFVPFGVDEYVMGMFRTASGPLYVNPGIGWFPWPIRFNCRPEITVFEV